MSHGSGPAGSYDLLRLGSVPRDQIRTHVTLRMPFGVPGMTGAFDVAMPRSTWRMVCRADYLGPKLVLDQLEAVHGEYDANGMLTTIVSDNTRSGGEPTNVIALNPDRWGRSWRTIVKIEAPEFIDPQYDHDHSQLLELAVRILTPCCACINRIVDTLVYVGGDPSIPNVVPTDFWSLEATYSGPHEVVGSLKLYKLHTIWWGVRKARMGTAEETVRELLAADAGLPISDELLVSSQRKNAIGDYRGAVIDAVCAVEAALGLYLDTVLETRGVSNSQRKVFLGPHGVSLSQRATVLLPLLHEVGIPDEILAAFSQENSKRNHIVHRGDKASESDATRAIAAASMLIDCLRGYSRVIEHWDGQTFRKPRPTI